jgi:hypothetical protein
MERRDILKDQIEQMGRLLGKMLSTFLGLKARGKLDEALEVSQQQIKEEAGIDVATLVQMDEPELTSYLRKQNFAESHLETFAEYFTAIGESKVDQGLPDGILYLRKALVVLEYADLSSRTASLVRLRSKQAVQKLIDDNTTN